MNSLNFSPETGRLVLTTGDGGSGYDPFNLSQNNLEIAGKIIEIDVDKNSFVNSRAIVTRFDELPLEVQDLLTVMAKGVRNVTGITFQRIHQQYMKYVGLVGQDLVESIFAFIKYQPVPVRQLVEMYAKGNKFNENGWVNFGWRGWEGDLPTSIIRDCPVDANAVMKTATFYDETIDLVTKRNFPLTCYYHQDPRPNKIAGTALTGVQVYMGHTIPHLTGAVVFTDFANRKRQPPHAVHLHLQDLGERVNKVIIKSLQQMIPLRQAAYFTSLGTNLNQTRLYLGVYASQQVTDVQQGAVFEVIS